MKKILFTLMVMLLPMMVQADFLGLKKADEFISMRVITLDSAGIRTKPDSVHIFTYLDGGTALQFNARSTTYPFAIGIDTSKIYGDTTYWFIDQIQDIDGTPTPADYTLTINIVMWGDGGIPTDNWGTVQVLGDSLGLYLSEIRDTTFGIIDTLQLQDGWVAREASLFDATTDSVFVDVSTAQNSLLSKIADTTWLSSLEARDGIAGSFGDSAQSWGATAAGGTDTANIKIMMNQNWTSASSGQGWANMIADSVLNRPLGDTVNNSIFAKIMRDASAASAQAIANNTDIGKVQDTVNAIIDTLQRFTKAASDTLQGIIDTLQNQDNWVAREASLFDGNLNLDNATGTLSDAQIDEIGVNVTSISGVSAVADNLEEILDDDGVGSDMDLNQLAIVATGTNDDALVITGDGTGEGVKITGGATGHGMEIIGGATSGDAMNLSATDGDGIDASGGTNGAGMTLTGAGSGDGLSSTGGTTGHGGDFAGGSGAATIGIRAASSGTGGSSYGMRVFSNNASGLYVTGGSAGGAGHGVLVDVGSGTGDGLRIRSGSGATGDAVDIASSSTNGVGFRIAGSGTGSGLLSTGGATGDGMSLVGGGTSGDAFALSVTSGDFIESAASDEIGLATWNTSATTSFTSGSMGDSAIGGINTWGQGGVALGASDIVAIADTIFHRDSADVNDGAATSFGTLLMKPAYVQGSSSLDSSTLAGWLWNTPQANHTTAGTFGKYLDVEISSIGSGSGAFSYQLVTYDSTTSQVIPGTNLAVRNINQSALIATGKSDLLGSETFNLDADSFIIVATSPGYIYQTFDTLIVTGAGIDTVFGDQFDPGSPVLPALCRVYGYLYSVSAVPEKDAVVRAFLPAGVAQSGNLIISPFMVTTTSDSSGYFFLDLIRSDSLVPAATQYDLIIERSDGTIVHKRITVPDSTSWQLDW